MNFFVWFFRKIYQQVYTACGHNGLLLLTLANWCLNKLLNFRESNFYSEWYRRYNSSLTGWQCDYWGSYRGHDLWDAPGYLIGWASVLGIYIPPIVSIVGAVSRIQSWESNVLLRTSGLTTWLNPSKASMSKFRILAGRCGGLFTLYLPKTILLSKFPSLLKLLHSNLTWSAFFFWSPLSLCVQG